MVKSSFSHVITSIVSVATVLDTPPFKVFLDLTLAISFDIYFFHNLGGLMCLGAVLSLNHSIDTFISLSGPLAGQYGSMFI